MPASLTRVCPSCSRDLPTPSAFRELDEQDGPGRPPVHCRECRHADPKLAAKHERNVEKRAARRDHHAAMSARSEAQIKRDRDAAHPRGVKACPVIAGCGRELPIASFNVNRSMRDGLEGVCGECRDAHKAARSLK
ncbi:hypothetical protein SEA_CEN1621_43 [Microbacterium phage Cen1621]|uniref:Uncharacterized protein n=1 Tax=Microbacterium phage Cen1621 TaxID=2965191 RepID=A0A9E7QAP6_9CAUD|nr:hypothetical protein SEA_CEN1621_43 [Microbacterium phage Cen1621]